MTEDAQTLRRLPSVRARCSEIYKLAQEGRVDSFTLDESRYEDIVDLCSKTIIVGFPDHRRRSQCSGPSCKMADPFVARLRVKLRIGQFRILSLGRYGTTC